MALSHLGRVWALVSALEAIYSYPYISGTPLNIVACMPGDFRHVNSRQWFTVHKLLLSAVLSDISIQAYPLGLRKQPAKSVPIANTSL